jgi:phosphatidylglycerophosphatase A
MTPARFVASVAGAGLLKPAPGTVGSAVALLPGLALLMLSPWALAAGVIVASLAGLWAIRAAGAGDDPGWVVIDELAGQWLALLALPGPSWLGALLAFLLFRAFDIIKPGPIGRAEHLPGAWGVMADDLLGGLAAAVLLAILRWVAPGIL